MYENLIQFKEALAVGLLICLFGAIAGAQVVQRRVIFVGVALSQLAAAGVAFGLLVGIAGFHLDPHLNESAMGRFEAIGAALLTLCGVLFISLFGHSKRLGEGGLIGVIYASGGALLILFLNKAGHPNEVNEILFGNIIFVTHAVFLQTFYILPGVLAFFLLFHKELALFSFDPEMARAMGYRMAWWNFLFYAALGLGLAAAINAGGLLFLFGSLILPVLAALQLTQLNRWIVPVAFVIGAGCFVPALLIPTFSDLPTGALTVAFQAAVLLLAIGVAKLLRRHD